MTAFSFSLPPRRWLFVVMVFSFLVNLLMLTGPMYMLQVYDRVLSSRSLDTLLALTLIMGVLFLFMGVFDFIRSRIMARYGLAWSSTGQELAQSPGLSLSDVSARLKAGEGVSRGFSHPSMLGVMDLIWVPLFLCALWMLHPFIALATVGGLCVSVLLAFMGWMFARGLESGVEKSSKISSEFERNTIADSSVLHVFGVWRLRRKMWVEGRRKSEDAQLSYQDMTGGWSTATKTFRMFFQSAILGLGAYLAVTGVLTPGAMIAGSILAGRALAPVDQVVGGFPVLMRLKKDRKTIMEAMKKETARSEPLKVESRVAPFEMTSVSYQEPGQRPLLMGVSVKVEPGSCLAVFGESGSGKSVLARLASGLWSASSGSVVVQNIPIEQLDENIRADVVRYVGQDPHLPAGRLLDIMRGFNDKISEQEVMDLVKSLGLLRIITSLSSGFDTQVESGGVKLPMAVRRGVLLVQALLGSPRLLILDMPELAIGSDSVLSLRKEIKKHLDAGVCVIMITNDLDLLVLSSHMLVLDKGRVSVFGEAHRVVDKYAQVLESGDIEGVPAALRPAISRRRAAREKRT